MTSQSKPDLATLIKRLERRNKRRQATTAILAGSAVLAVSVLATPFFRLPQKDAAITAVSAPPALAFDDRAFDGVSLTGKAAIVYDLTTGEALYAKNADKDLPLASLTKLLTTYAAVRTLGTTSPVAIGPITEINDAADLVLTEGERFRFEDLAKLALVASSNVAAEAIATAAEAKRSDSTASLLAGAAAAAGLSNTRAVNASGLDESLTESGGYGSARDVAKLSGALLAIAPEIVHATVEPSVSVTSLAGATHTLPNTNQGVVALPGALLSKTGFTDLAGGNLAVVFDAGIGHPVAVVVLGSTREGRFADVNALVARTLSGFATAAAATAP
jgi:D-alanyl-D-alanine carboxypeptidase (penicillin-binding protein 5/6)